MYDLFCKIHVQNTHTNLTHFWKETQIYAFVYSKDMTIHLVLSFSNIKKKLSKVCKINVSISLNMKITCKHLKHVHRLHFHKQEKNMGTVRSVLKGHRETSYILVLVSVT